MSTDLARQKVNRKSGTERFHDSGTDLAVDLKAFWQWSVSDLVSNVTRGRLAEFIVARALGISTDGVRDEWASFDLLTQAGVRVEVKSAAYVQSWHQARLSNINFRTPKTRAWDAKTNIQSQEGKRQADVYVFAVLFHQTKATIDLLNVGQWRFYVLATSILNARTRSQHSIALSTLKKLCGAGCSFRDLEAAVDNAVNVKP